MCAAWASPVEGIYQNSEHSLVKKKLPPSEDNTFVRIFEKSTRIKKLGISSVKAIPTFINYPTATET